jgi:Holliday junction resolvase RusA-like endonuclease
LKEEHRKQLEKVDILDALTRIAYEDDSQISSLHLSRAYDATNPRMEITCVASTALN